MAFHNDHAEELSNLLVPMDYDGVLVRQHCRCGAIILTKQPKASGYANNVRKPIFRFLGGAFPLRFGMLGYAKVPQSPHASAVC